MKTTVAALQMTSTSDLKKNISHCLHLLDKALKNKAKLICLPENFSYVGPDSASAEGLDGSMLKIFKEYAKAHGIWLSLGGLPELGSISAKPFNAHVLIDDRGEVHAVYRKINLFKASITKERTYDESKKFEKGCEEIVAKLPFFTVGLTICFDVRFPKLFSSLAEKGAQVFLIPSAFTDITGKAHWEILLRSRAIENQCYVIAAAQCGFHNDFYKTHGHTMIVDPWGKILSECDDHDDMALAEIDMDFLMKIRSDMPIKRDLD